MLYQDGDRLTSDLKEALAWFGEQGSWELTSLFKLAGIEDYDEEERRILFDEEESCPEEFLIGWLEIEDQEC